MQLRCLRLTGARTNQLVQPGNRPPKAAPNLDRLRENRIQTLRAVG